MSTILIRTLIVYLVIMFGIQLTGKRQIGEIRLSEFVTTLILSELAAFPVMDPNIPLIYAVIPIVTLVAASVMISYARTKNNFFKRILDPKPCFLIERGQIKQQEMNKSRFTVEELVSEIRLKGYSDVSNIDYAILEASGKLSVIPKAEYANPTVLQMNLTPDNSGIAHPVVINGELNLQSVAAAGRTSEWVMKAVSDNGYKSLDDVLLMLLDDSGKITIVKKIYAPG